jgi:excisionase family DNA binding protein
MDGREATSPPAALLSIQEARRILGVARSTLYEIIASGDLPFVEIRGRRPIEPDALATYIAERRRRVMKP